MKKQDARAWLVILLVVTILLSGCKKGAQGTAVPTQAVPSNTAPSAEKSPLQSEEIQKTTPPVETGNPSPGEAGEGYPGPGEPGAGQVSSSEEAYPLPGTSPLESSHTVTLTTAPPSPAGSQTLQATPTRTVQVSLPSPSGTIPSPAYPGPGFQATTPAPQGTTPAGAPGTGSLTPSPTEMFGTLVPTGTPGIFPGLTPVPTVGAPTPTEFIYVVLPGLKATDPGSVSLASGKVQLIEFFAFWSLESQSMAPVVQRMEAKYKADMSFAFLDVDDPRTRPFQLDLGYSLTIHPHFYLIDRQGNKLMEWTGIVPEGELDQAIRQALSSG